jgi:predicted O-methyltransferase YrrM
MFRNIPSKVLQRMRRLEEMDAADRIDGTPNFQRLRQIPPDTGRFLALQAANAPQGTLMEIGTSGGYSTLWLALACRETGRKMITFELAEEKAAVARETFQQTGIEDAVELIVGDARQQLPGYEDIAFCFLDAEKDIYLDCYELVIARLVPGGMLREALEDFLNRARIDDRVDTLVVPIGKGELICRRTR